MIACFRNYYLGKTHSMAELATSQYGLADSIAHTTREKSGRVNFFYLLRISVDFYE